jgi:hypothetical protein
MQAEVFHLSYHPYRNDPGGGFQSSGLTAHRAYVNEHPGKGFGFGRGEAWGLDCMVAAYNLSDPQWRQRKRAWFEEVIQTILTGQGSCTGFIQAIISNKAVDGLYRARQQIEQGITENALQGLRESVFRDADPGRAAMTRDVMVDSFYAFIGEMAWFPGQAGPWTYTGVGPLNVDLPIWCVRGQMPGNAYTPNLETYLDWSSFAYAFEITGDPIFFERATTQIGGGVLLNRLVNQGTQNLPNRSALIALVQHESGQL